MSLWPPNRMTQITTVDVHILSRLFMRLVVLLLENVLTSFIE